jgi:hypothetical protein
MHIALPTLSRCVPLPVLKGSTFVKWGNVKQAAGLDRVIEILQVNKTAGSSGGQHILY